MKFPELVRFRKAEAKIYGRRRNYDFFREAWHIDGKRRMSSHRTYTAAKAAAENVVRELARGSQAAVLTPAEVADTRAALECLRTLNKSTGRQVTLFRAMFEYSEACSKLSRGDWE